MNQVWRGAAQGCPHQQDRAQRETAAQEPVEIAQARRYERLAVQAGTGAGICRSDAVRSEACGGNQTNSHDIASGLRQSLHPNSDMHAQRSRTLSDGGASADKSTGHAPAYTQTQFLIFDRAQLLIMIKPTGLGSAGAVPHYPSSTSFLVSRARLASATGDSELLYDWSSDSCLVETGLSASQMAQALRHTPASTSPSRAVAGTARQPSQASCPAARAHQTQCNHRSAAFSGRQPWSQPRSSRLEMLRCAAVATQALPVVCCSGRDPPPLTPCRSQGRVLAVCARPPCEMNSCSQNISSWYQVTTEEEFKSALDGNDRASLVCLVCCAWHS